MRGAAQFANAGPWRRAAEKLTCAIGHKFPTSATVLSFCRHLAAVIVEREGSRFERVAVFESGGKMSCSGQDNVGLYCTNFYFVGTIMGQHNDERPVVRLLHRAIKDGNVFFDIGANIGFYSFYLGPLCGVSGAVHAFEANPILIPHLRRSVELNKGNSNIIVNEVAVGREAGKTMELYDPDRIGGSSLFKLAWLDTARTVRVPVTTIDEYTKRNNIRRVDVVKIDIEGSELDAFRGMEESLKVCRPWLIVCELASLVGSDSHSEDSKSGGSLTSHPRRIADFLASKGYEPRYISEKDGRLSDIVDSKVLAQLSQVLLNVAFVLPNLRETRPDLFSV